MIKSLTERNIDETLQQKALPIVIEFWAGWCGACHIYAPMIDELERDFEGLVKIGRVDIDANPRLKAKFNIDELPVLLFFRNGRVTDCLTGTVPRKILRRKVESLING